MKKTDTEDNSGEKYMGTIGKQRLQQQEQRCCSYCGNQKNKKNSNNNESKSNNINAEEKCEENEMTKPKHEIM